MTARLPMRQCAGCGARRPQRELRRYTARDGVLAVDGRNRAAGRGVYLCTAQACAGTARRKGALAWRLRTRIENYEALGPAGSGDVRKD